MAASVEEIRNFFRALLVSTKKELTVGELGRDFENQEGRIINPVALGFQSLTALVSSMSGTFEIYKKPGTLGPNGLPQLFVRLKDAKNMEHIDKFVIGQRVKVPGRFAIRSRVSNLVPRHPAFQRHNRSLSDEGSPPRNNQYRGRRSPSPRGRRSPPARRSSSPRRRSPERRRSRERRRSGRDSRSPSPRQRRRSGRDSRSISPRTRRPSQRSSTSGQRRRSNSSSSMSSSSSSTGPSSSRSKPKKDSGVANLQKQGPATSLKRQFAGATQAKPAMALTQMKPDQPKPPQPVSTEPSPSKKVEANLLPVVHNFAKESGARAPCNNSFVYDPQSVTDFGVVHVAPCGSGLQAKVHPAAEFPATVHNLQLDENISVKSYATGKFLPGCVKRNLVRLLLKFPGGIPASQLEEKYKTCFKQSLNPVDLGFKNVEEMAASAPDTISVNKDKASDATLFTGSYDPSQPTPVLPPMPLQVPAYVRERIEKIVRDAYIEGINLDKLAEIYKAKHGVGLDYRSFGFDSVMMVLGEIDSITVQMVGTELKAFLSEKASKELLPKIPPSNRAVPVGFKMPESQIIFSDADPKQYVEVCELCSPDHFYINMLKRGPQLNKMMDDLQLAYLHAETSGLQVTELKLGMYVVAKHRNEWQRAMTISTVSSTQCKILFVDFGTTKNVEINTLYHLIDNSKFKLEHLAVRASLYNLKPSRGNPSWSNDSIQRMTELVSANSMLAVFHKTDGTTIEIELEQLDGKLQPIQVNVGRALVTEGHAEFISKPEELVPLISLDTAMPTAPSVASTFANTTVNVPTVQPGPVPLPLQAPAVIMPEVPQPTPAFGPESDMPLQIMQSIARNLAAFYGEAAVRQAVNRQHAQPFASTDPTMVSEMTGMLWNSVAAPGAFMAPNMFAPRFRPAMMPAPGTPLMGPNMVHPYQQPMNASAVVQPRPAVQDQKPTDAQLVARFMQSQAGQVPVRQALTAAPEVARQPAATQRPVITPSQPRAGSGSAQPMIKVVENKPREPKPSVTAIVPDQSDKCSFDDDDITVIEDIQEARNVYGPEVKKLKNGMQLFLLLINKRKFMMCENFAVEIAERPSWDSLMKRVGRTNAAMEVHRLNVTQYLNVLKRMHGLERFYHGQESVFIAPIDNLVKIGINEEMYPIFSEFKKVATSAL